MSEERVNEQVDDQIDDIVIETDLPDEDSPDDSTTKIVMSGKEYDVSQEVANAIQAERVGMDKKLGETSEELGELRKYQRIMSQQDVVTKERPADEPGYDYETAIYDDANAAIGHLKREIMEEVRGEYQNDQAQKESGKRFWDNFWRENADLGRDEIREDAQGRIMSQLSRYSHLPDNKATRDRIADETRQYYLNIAKGFGAGGNNGSANYSEGASNSNIITNNRGQGEPERKSTSQILKEMKEKKRLARLEHGGT